jgi:hypothetical protein
MMSARSGPLPGVPTVGVWPREDPKPTSKSVLRVPNMDGDARRVKGGLSWFGQKKVLRPAGRGEYCILLHLSIYVGVTSCKRGSRSQVLKRKSESTNEIAWDVDLLRRDGDWLIACPSFAPLRRVPCLPFYRVKRRQGLQGCLRSEVLLSAVEVAVATCPKNGRPSPDRRLVEAGSRISRGGSMVNG